MPDNLFPQQPLVPAGFNPMPGLWSPLQPLNPYTPTSQNSFSEDELRDMGDVRVDPKQQKTQNVPQKGIHLNYDHIFNSMVIGNLGQAVANNSENSYQNAVLRFNQQKFNPLNYLPENPNVSEQAKYGMEEFGDGGETGEDPKAKQPAPQPIVVNNPNDPRLKAYQDSLSLHNMAQLYNMKSYDLKTPSKPVEYHKGDGWNKENIKSEREGNIFPIDRNSVGWDKESLQLYDLGQNMNTKGIKSNISPSGYYQGEGYFPYYKKPVQPVVYQKAPPEPQLQKLPFSPIGLNSLPPTQSSANILPVNLQNEQSNNYRVEYTDPDTGQSTHRDFPNEKMGSTFQNAIGGNRTGYYFAEGGTYELSEDQINDLIKQGYEIEKL